MAATYYAQILRSWDWAAIRDVLDAVVRVAREDAERDGFVADSVHMWNVAYYGPLNLHASADIADGDDDVIEALFYFGSVMNLVPSGKFYAPWSNVSVADRDADMRWWAALNDVARRHGLNVTNGEGDPTDVFIVLYEPVNDNVLAAALMPDDVGAH